MYDDLIKVFCWPSRHKHFIRGTPVSCVQCNHGSSGLVINGFVYSSKNLVLVNVSPFVRGAVLAMKQLAHRPGTCSCCRLWEKKTLHMTTNMAGLVHFIVPIASGLYSPSALWLVMLFSSG